MLGVVPAAVLTGCSRLGGRGESASSGGASATASVKAAEDADRDADLARRRHEEGRFPRLRSAVTVADGTFATVKVTGNDAPHWRGPSTRRQDEMDVDEEPLTQGTKYTVAAQAQGGATRRPRPSPPKSPGETASSAASISGANSTSGVGMPVSINFTHAVKDRAAVQKAITVTAEPAVEVVG
ncbi:Ig-like domain-containing protein, partial [Streptomyces sp. L7]